MVYDQKIKRGSFVALGGITMRVIELDRDTVTLAFHKGRMLRKDPITVSRDKVSIVSMKPDKRDRYR